MTGVNCPKASAKDRFDSDHNPRADIQYGGSLGIEE
jgi:hypothetical protein